MSTTATTQIDELRISPRRVLRPGMRFRTLRGSGPRLIGSGAAWGVYGTFRCKRIYRCRRCRRRILCEAVSETYGGTFTLQLTGPATKTSGIHWRPYKIALVREQEAASR